jgi:hypothetical protein
MKKVYQQNVSDVSGDCMRATVASLFEEDIENVPNFIEHGHEWWTVFEKYFESKGYKETAVLYNPIMYGKDILPEFSLDRLSEFNGIEGLFYASVSSPTYNPNGELSGITHAVISDKNYNIVHDPNPNYKDEKRIYPLHDRYNGIRQIEVFEKIDGVPSVCP